MLRWILLLMIILCVEHVTSKKANKIAQGITGFRIIDGLCKSSRSDRLVYRYRNDSYVYVAFDILPTGMVDVFSWDIITSPRGTFISIDMKQERMYALDFRKNVNRDHVIGGTNKRYQKKFKSRMERKMKHCKELKKKKKYCKLSAIQSVFVRIEMREVHYLNDPFGDCSQFYEKPEGDEKKKKRKDRKSSEKD